MQRLLADAEKLSGVKYDINNLGDVYDAIHVIQQDLGLTGVAAQEASETFTGSFNAMKAAGENLLANLALGNDITPYLSTLLDATGAFLTNNFFPMIGNIFQSLPQVITQGLIPALNQALSMVIDGLNMAAENADSIVNTGMQIVTALSTALINAAPALLDAAVNCAIAFGNALISYDWGSFGQQLMTSLQGLFPSESATSIMQNVYDGITAALPQLLTTGTDIIMNLANGIMAALPNMVTTAGELITQFASFLLQNAPTILNAAADLILSLAQGLTSNLPQIAMSAVKVIMEFEATILKNLPTILAAGGQIIAKLILGFTQNTPQLLSAIVKICQQSAESFKKYDWIALGKNVVNGIIKGIKDMGSAMITAILSLCQGALGAVKKFFGIASPSKVMADEVGRYIPEGIALGIEKNSDSVYDAMNDLKTDAIEAAAIMDIGTTPQFSGSQSNDGIMARMDAMLTLMERYFPEMADSNGNISISAINKSLGAAYS